ncbi:MAG TPA: Gfo/Idh/MocA family oxidoreductase [Candidatus Dormibacteraeota bacterium]|nr:Gfo/Idh/MocA family oxidoreductase [Candidatus Dormibacteraeota bacterium]
MARSQEEPIRVALIGYGMAGSVFHAPLIGSTPGLKLASIVTGNRERQADAIKQHPGVRILDDVGALWNSAADHDLAVVATPNRTHVPLGLAALEAGLPVVVDKPIATTAAGGRQLANEAHRRGLLLTVFHNRRWDGDLLTLRGLIDDGTLGPVMRFESRYERWRPTPRAGSWRESGAPEDAGGLLFDLGSHLIDQALLLFGRPKTIYAELDRRRAGVRADDDGFIALDQPGEVRSHLWTSAVAAQPGPRFRVLGRRSAYVKFGMDVQEEALRQGGRPTDPDWGRELPESWGSVGAGDDIHPIETVPGNYTLFYQGVVSALRDGVPPPVDPLAAVAVIEVIEAARQSATSGSVVRFS